MRYLVTILSLLLFGLTSNAYEDIKIRVSKADLKKMAEFEKKRADDALSNARDALKNALENKRKRKKQ